MNPIRQTFFGAFIDLRKIVAITQPIWDEHYYNGIAEHTISFSIILENALETIDHKETYKAKTSEIEQTFQDEINDIANAWDRYTIGSKNK